MSDTTVLEVKLDDLGTIEKADKKLKNFRGTFDSLDKQVSKGLGGGKGSSGWKKATMGTTEYDIARGSAGATGASGRDFANQARGLDGLVRLYATYAANVFAAGAAFRALSEAADTTNMIEGMNQLGAASGIALGTIAQNLRNATDGAISMREAMEATTKGTAAGLTGKQMTDLGLVANKASKALGIGMPDAISRLTRGISKLEPELLDELGLFTKIGPATENYARSIGKTTGSLTDFERRQAFANAVLKEGMDKFSSIEVAANPYDKLLASLKDLSFVALEITNKAFVPLVNVLSQNPTILLGVLAAIGASIIKSAIPALGQYRDNLKKTADASRMTFSAMYADQQEQIGLGAAAAGAAAEKAYRKSATTQSKIQELSKNSSTFSKTNKTDYAALAGKDPFALTAAEIKSLDRRANDLAKRNSEEAARLKAHIAELKAIRAGAENAELTSRAVALNKGTGVLSTPYSNDIIQKRTLNKLASDSIRSTAAETQAVYGARTAYTKLTEETKKAMAGKLMVQIGTEKNGDAVMKPAPKMGAFQAGLTLMSGTIGIVAQKIGSLISAFGNIGMAIGAAVGAFLLFDSFLTKTEKESDAFSKAIQATSDAVDNTTRTLDKLAKEPGIATASIQGFLALSNASSTATSSIEAQLDATKVLLKALNSSGWDRAKDRIASVWGGDVATKSAKQLAEIVQSQLELFRTAGMGEDAEAKFKKAIGVDSLDFDTVAEKFKKSNIAQKEYAKTAKALDVTLKETSATLQEFKTSTDAVTKAYEEFIQSTASSNPLFKIGAALQDVSVSMDKLSNKSMRQINAAFNDLASTPKKIAQFGPEFIAQFVTIRQEFQTTLEKYSAYEQQINKIQAQIDKKTQQRKNAKDTREVVPGMLGPRGSSVYQTISAESKRAAFTSEIDLLEQDKKAKKDILVGLDTKSFIQAKDLFIKGVTYAFEKGSDYIKIALGQASAKAALTIAQAGIGALTGERAAQETTRLKQEEIKIQMNQIQSTIGLITSQTLLTATLAENTAMLDLIQAKNDNKSEAVQKGKADQLLAAGIFKNAMKDVESGKLKTSNLQSRLTGDKNVDAFLLRDIGKVQIETAAQEANRTELGGKSKANEIEGARAAALGRLDDLNKERNLRNEINQQKIAGLDILTSIDTLNATQRVQEKIDLENTSIKSKQLQEIEGYTTAITNAQALGTDKGRDEADTLNKLLVLVRERQKEENDNKPIADRLKLKTTELDVATKLSALNEALLDQDLARVGIINSLVGFSTEQNVLATTTLENKKLENKFALELKKITDELVLLEEDKKRDNTKSIALKQTELALVTQRQEKEKENKGLQDALKLLEARLDIEQKLAGFAKTTADARGQQAEDELNYRKELGLVTSFEFVKEKADLDRSRVGRETAEGQTLINQQIAKKSLLEKEIQDIESDGILTATEKRESVDEMTRSIAAQSTALDATNKQKLNAIDLNEKLGSKMTGFSKIVEGSFQSMADALADFARTGKLDFKGLVDSMIVELIRFELRAQMSSLFKGVGGLQGMMNMFTGGVGSITADPSRLVDLVGGSVMGNSLAKGGAYDTGLRTFAQGGMFTNSVVNQPTLFKFAQGTGLMGEAGPEAIMPLKRDSNGNLGVRGPGNSGGNVDVVVNNYGNEKATTKETTDSRGNRRIEVIVGDMVASELSRPGSSVQQSLSSNYGNKPAVARR